MKSFDLLKGYGYEYSCDHPHKIKFELSDDEIKELKQHRDYCIKHSVTMEVNCVNAKLLDEDNDEVDFRKGYEFIVITCVGSLHYRAENKWVPEDWFESEEFELN